VHVIATYSPLMQRVLRVEPLRFEQWTYPLTLAAALLGVIEFYKWQKAKRGMGSV